MATSSPASPQEAAPRKKLTSWALDAIGYDEACDTPHSLSDPHRIAQLYAHRRAHELLHQPHEALR